MVCLRHYLRWLTSFTYLVASSAIADGSLCDRLASVEADPHRKEPGVTYDNIVGVRVIEACLKALKTEPENARYWLQLGRGYLKEDRGADMMDAFKRSESFGYPAATFALAVVYHTGNGISGSDPYKAELLYKDAYRSGVGYAAMGLTRLYDEVGSPFFDEDKALLWKLRFDAFQMGE